MDPIEPPQPFADRIEAVGRVTSKAMLDAITEQRRRGRDVISLRGAPYWLPPEHVLAAAERAVREPDAAPSNGFEQLRQAVADRLGDDDEIEVDPQTQVLVTAGAMHGLNLICSAVLNPGDEVIVPSPAFGFYGPIRLAGGVDVYAPTHQHNGWQWDIDAIESAVTPRTRMILINSPTNPTGYVATRRDLEAVAALAERHNLWVVSDECYDTMVYDGHEHLRFAALPGVQDRAVTVCSMTKSYAMQPWRIGYLVGPPKLTAAVRRLLEWHMMTGSHIAQRAAAAALAGPQEWVKQTAVKYQHSRDLMSAGLADAPGISFASPGGTPFLFLNVSGLQLTGGQFVDELMANEGVAAEPGGPYGSESHVRLMFGAEDDVIHEAARRITAAAKRLAVRTAAH